MLCEKALLIGDFNDIRSMTKKFGGRDHSNSSIEDYRWFINDANLVYLGFDGPSFTWSNKKEVLILSMNVLI